MKNKTARTAAFVAVGFVALIIGFIFYFGYSEWGLTMRYPNFKNAVMPEIGKAVDDTVTVQPARVVLIWRPITYLRQKKGETGVTVSVPTLFMRALPKGSGIPTAPMMVDFADPQMDLAKMTEQYRMLSGLGVSDYRIKIHRKGSEPNVDYTLLAIEAPAVHFIWTGKINASETTETKHLL